MNPFCRLVALVGLLMALPAYSQEPVPSPAPTAPTASAAPAAPAATVASSPAGWAGGLDLRVEQARLRNERTAAQAARSREEASCKTRFAVTECLDRVRRQWQPVLEDLRRQEIALNDLDRKQRSAEQQRKLDDKTSPAALEEQAQRRSLALADHEARLARAAQKAGDASAPDGKPRDPSSAAERGGSRITPEQAAANAQAYERRVQEAQAKRERLLKRQAERAKPAASALPVPP